MLTTQTIQTPASLRKKIYIASDHAGVDLKKQFTSFFASEGIDYVDLGTNSLEPVDYPDYAQKLASHLQEDKDSVGVLICGSGIGVCMAANRYPWIRAAVGNFSLEQVMLSRAHNDANVLCLGARLVDADFAKKAFTLFYETPFEGGRHAVRVQKMTTKA